MHIFVGVDFFDVDIHDRVEIDDDKIEFCEICQIFTIKFILKIF